MTSTNLTHGMGENRNSSRVLKPPGGGHSDIFGLYQPQDQPAPRSRHNHPKSSIGEVFSTTGAPLDNSSNQKSEEEQPEPELQPTVIEDEAPKPTVPTPQRARIPPGGFSSGLW